MRRNGLVIIFIVVAAVVVAVGSLYAPALNGNGPAAGGSSSAANDLQYGAPEATKP